MDGLKKYQVALMETIQPVLERITEEQREEMEKVYRNHLFDLEGLKRANSDISEEDGFKSRIFFGFTEINETYEVLKDIEAYIRNTSHEEGEVSSVREIKYHVNSFLNEIYILKERLIAYLNFIDKEYKRGEDYRRIRPSIEPLYKMVSSGLQNVVNTRGYHVHQRRYSDDDLDRLSTLKLLADNTEGPWDDLFRVEYLEVREKWIDRVDSSNESIETLNDRYFGKLYGLLFEEEDLILPF